MIYYYYYYHTNTIVEKALNGYASYINSPIIYKKQNFKKYMQVVRKPIALHIYIDGGMYGQY